MRAMQVGLWCAPMHPAGKTIVVFLLVRAAKRIYSRHSTHRYKIVANGRETLAGELSAPVPDRTVQLRTRLVQENVMLANLQKHKLLSVYENRARAKQATSHPLVAGSWPRLLAYSLLPSVPEVVAASELQSRNTSSLPFSG